MMSRNFAFLIILFFISSQANWLTAQNADKILWTANWSPDDQYIVAGGMDQVLRVYDGKNYAFMLNDTLDESILRLRWHPFKNILAVAATGDGSRLIDFGKGYQIILEGLEGAGARAIAWNDKGEKLAIADYEGIVHIFDQEGQRLRSFGKENSKSFTGIDWNPITDNILVIGEFVREYNSEGTLLKKFMHRPYHVLLLSVAWQPSGNTYVLGDYGDSDNNMPPALQTYDANHNLILQNEGSLAEYRNVCWSPDGTRLATSGDALRIWTSTGELLYQSMPEDDNLWGIDWNSDGTLIVSSSEKGQIKIWNDRAELLKTLL